MLDSQLSNPSILLGDRLRMLAFKKFLQGRRAAFGMKRISNFARAVASEYLSIDVRETVAVQVPIASSIIVAIASHSGVSTTVRQSFGGLYYQEMNPVFRTDISGVQIQVFIRLSKIETSPSMVRIDAPCRLVNDGVCWTEDYVIGQFTRSLWDGREPKKVASSRRVAPLTDERILIAIPVYNSPHLFAKLFEDLSQTLPNSPKIEVLIIDDHGDDFSNIRLADCVRDLRISLPEPKIRFIRHETNQGFINTCNEMFEEARGHDIFVLLTTDIRLPHLWLERMAEAFRSDPMVSIATPWAINGANLAVRNLPGHSWRDMDDLARQQAPRFPDAETTVGYCMAVRPSSLGERELLFSLAFENGYGDDSDLYYRTVSKGMRGVVVDNMVIYHQGGGSFDLLANVDDLRAENFKVFSSIWMPEYKKRIHPATEIQNRIRKSIFAQPAEQACDVLFVLPLDYRKAGGVSAVFNLVEGLQDRGVAASIYSLRHHEGADQVENEYRAFSYNDIKSLDRLPAKVGHPKIVIATSHDTVPFVKAITTMMGGQYWLFLQGPEMAFSSGAFSAAVAADVKSAERILCVSDYLADLVEAFTGRAADVIPYGPDPFEFYSAGKNQDKTIAVQFAGRADKGSDLAGIAVPILLDSGYTVEAFGEVSDYFDYDPRLEPHGFANPRSLRKIFQKCSHYLDLSHYEGLGMLSLEALFCGALPVTLRNGGSASLLEANNAGIMLDGVPDLHRLPRIIERKTPLIDVERSSAVIKEKANLYAAIRRFAELLEENV